MTLPEFGDLVFTVSTQLVIIEIRRMSRSTDPKDESKNQM